MEGLLIRLQIDHLRLQILIQTVFAIRPADTGFTPACMEALHRFKVFTVNVGLAELKPLNGFHRDVQVLRINRRG